MVRDLNNRELEWINKLLSVNFMGREILKKQIAKSQIVFEQNYDYVSIKFLLKETLEHFPYKVRVPIEMRAFQDNSSPILFLLHVVNGLVFELEILTADSSKININAISLDKVKFEINKEVKQ